MVYMQKNDSFWSVENAVEEVKKQKVVGSFIDMDGHFPMVSCSRRLSPLTTRRSLIMR
jgi:hypothetical protein